MQQSPANAVRASLRWVTGHAIPRVALRRGAKSGDLLSRLILLEAPETPEGIALVDRIRSAGSVYRGRYGFVSARMNTVRAVLTSNDFRAGVDPEHASGAVSTMSNWATRTEVFDPRQPPSLLVTEPPDHSRYRKLVTRVFSGRAVEALRPRVEAVAKELLEDIERDLTDGAAVDVVSRYCTPMPLTTICDILGVPPDERETVRSFGARGSSILDFGLGWRRFRDAEQALVDFDGWLAEHVRRVRRTPGDDLFSQLVEATDDGGMSDHELKSLGGLLLVAGFETTVNLLGNGIALLVTHPAELAKLRADPGLWSNAVEEVLRYDPPVPITDRSAMRPTNVDDTEVGAAEHVTTLLSGANRDPDVFAEPARFDVARANARDHISFAAGRHFCLGSGLARLQGDIGLRRFFDHFDNIELAEGAERRSSRTLRGYARLPIRLV